MKDIRQSKEYASYLKTNNWIIKKIDSDYVFIKKILSFSLLKFQRPKKINLEKLYKLAKKHKTIYISVEPDNVIASNRSNLKKLLIENNFKLTKPFLPSKTLVLDLTKSSKFIFNNFSKDTKYSINKFKKTNIKIQTNTNLKVFHNSWKSSVPSSRYVLNLKQLNNLKSNFKNNMYILSTENAGAIFLIANNKAYYWHAFSNNNARKTYDSYKILYEGILWAKKQKAKQFDFEGIYDERFPDKKWLGFTSFKKKFGGKEKEYEGAYVKWSLKNIFRN